MKSKKISFWGKLVFSIVDNRIFPLVVKEKLISAFGYLCKLVLLFSVVTAISSTANFFNAFPRYIKEFEEKMPDFEIKSGSFYSPSDISFDFNNAAYVYYSKGQAISETELDTLFTDTNKKFDTYLIINEKTIDVYRKNTANTLYKFGKMIFSEVSDVSKTSLISYAKDFSESLWGKGAVLLGFIITTFIVYGIYRLWLLVLYSFSVFFLNVVFMNKLRGRDYFKIAIYVSSLPVLLETIAFVIAKGLPDAASFITMLISIIYTYYALNAIKLDSILLSAIGDTPEEKIRNAINQAQQELQKQLDELEEKEKEKKEKQEENSEKELEEKKEELGETPEAETEDNPSDNQEDDNK